VSELGRPLGEELLVPTRIYTPDLLALIETVEVHAISHVTGGGLASNLSRVMPGSCEVRIDRTTWSPPPIFDLIATLGKVSEADMEATFNMGVGMVLVLPAEAADAGLSLLDRRGVPAWVCGSVAPAGSGTREHVSLFGTHPHS
jgi:phosphoribosylformylglycinamidine cyclo-ligase